MNGENELAILLKTLKPELQKGDYVFCTTDEMTLKTLLDKAICFFRETEAITVILPKMVADELKLYYNFVASWITLTVHSSLQAVGLTAAFSQALSQQGISCNVVAACYHDHIFVAVEDAEKAINL